MCDVYAQEKHGHEALVSAVHDQDLYKLRELVRTGVDINGVSGSGDSALSTAVLFERLDCVITLIMLGADVNLANNDGTRPLHYAIGCSESRAYVSVLLERRADVNAKDNKGWTAIHYAAVPDNYLVMKLLLDSGGDINALAEGKRPIGYAAIYDSLGVFDILFSKDALLCGDSFSYLRGTRRDHMLSTGEPYEDGSELIIYLHEVFFEEG